MEAVSLETDVLGPASQATYRASLSDYQFPGRYLKYFGPLYEGSAMLSVINEPRDGQPHGVCGLGGSTRRSSTRIGWARVTYRVTCLQPMQEFERPVSREIHAGP